VIISPVYEKILRAIRDSAYYTEDPSEACLFVLSLDTTDRFYYIRSRISQIQQKNGFFCWLRGTLIRYRLNITILRDRISDNYIKDLSALINALPQEIWNEGRNHLIFNLYYGSYPDYSQKDIGFLTKNAIVAWASADSRVIKSNKNLKRIF
jgi:hypothetical protein